MRFVLQFCRKILGGLLPLDDHVFQHASCFHVRLAGHSEKRLVLFFGRNGNVAVLSGPHRRSLDDFLGTLTRVVHVMVFIAEIRACHDVYTCGTCRNLGAIRC